MILKRSIGHVTPLSYGPLKNQHHSCRIFPGYTLSVSTNTPSITPDRAARVRAMAVAFHVLHLLQVVRRIQCGFTIYSLAIYQDLVPSSLMIEHKIFVTGLKENIEILASHS